MSGCANTPPVPTFQETAQAFESKKITYERIQVSVDADCLDGECEISEHNLNVLTTVITRMNDEAEMRVTAYNYSIDSLAHATYAYNMLDRSLSQSNRAYDKLEWTNIVKQSLLGLMCIGTLAL